MSVQPNVVKYCQLLLFCTELPTADVSDGFCDFLYNLGTEDKRLVEKQCKNIETTTKSDHETIDTFLRSVNSKLSRAGTSS